VAVPAALPPPQTLCQSEPAFQLAALPADGFWFGSGITDESGIFTGDSAQAGLNNMFYVYEAFPQFVCTTATQITILPIDAGFAQAACPGSAPFQLIGFSPSGGIWSGPQVSPGGLFDPASQGEFILSYTVNGCTEELTVFVDDISQNQVFADSVCQSDAPDTLLISPPGGRWYGAGIIDSIYGIFDPGETDAGLITLNYVLNGCSRQVQLYVKEIWAGWNRSACPAQEAYQLEDFAPAGGLWSGDGITPEGVFDPAWNNGQSFNTDVIYSHPNGCTDTARIWVFYTSIGLDTLVFCSDNQGVLLNREELDTDPWEGVWLGPGVLNGDEPDEAEFNAQLAGNGIHVLVFEGNTCADSVVFIVQQSFLSDLPVSCEAAPPFDIEIPAYVSGAGGSFEGPGIINNEAVFYPGEAGQGQHQIEYISAAGCRDTISAEVIEFIQAQINASAAPLCYTDSLIPIEIYPPDALLTGNGIVDNEWFNPLIAGEGPHLLSLSTGEGFCISTDTATVFVAPAIGYSLFVSRDTLCYGEVTSMLVNAYGGNGNLITYTWNQGLPPLQQQIISPEVSTVYQLEISDGCARIRDTVSITVFPEILFNVSLSEPACYGELGFAEINSGNAGNYEVLWRGDLYEMNMQLPGESSRTYMAVVTDTSSGCSVDTTITIPGYPLVQALFAISPNEECVSFDQDSVRFIDLSTGGFSGSWSFGDGTSEPYQDGINPAHDYDTYGIFPIVLEISDTNGCSSKLEKNLCIQQPFRLYIPTAITLNNDLMNDVLLVQGTGIKQLDLFVYNRMGNEIWHGRNGDHAWDGKFQGREVQSGVYAFVVEVEWVDGTLFTKAGTVTVIR
jgi:gliding motility-associated-like protein